MSVLKQKDIKKRLRNKKNLNILNKSITISRVNQQQVNPNMDKHMITILYLHIFSAFFSLALLIVRGIMQLSGKSWRNIKLLKILPHLSDTLLLGSGIIMVFTAGYGFPTWLLIKLVLLVVYLYFATQFFSVKKTPSPSHFYLSLIAFIAIILVGYFH